MYAIIHIFLKNWLIGNIFTWKFVSFLIISSPALNSILKGLGKLKLNEAKIALDLENNWAVVAEGIQTVLRREGYEAPYEALKNLTRGKDRVEESDIHAFIDVLEVSDAIKAELKKIRPENYTGIDLMSDHE